MIDIYNARTVDVQLKRTLKITGIIGFMLAAALIVEPSPFRRGLVVGTVVSIINSYLIYNRMKHIAEMSFNKAVAFMRAGFVMRLLLIMAVLYLTIQTAALDIYGVAFGVFIAPMVTVIDFNLSLIKDYRALSAKNKTDVKGGKLDEEFGRSPQ